MYWIYKDITEHLNSLTSPVLVAALLKTGYWMTGLFFFCPANLELFCYQITSVHVNIILLPKSDLFILYVQSVLVIWSFTVQTRDVILLSCPRLLHSLCWVSNAHGAWQMEAWQQELTELLVSSLICPNRRFKSTELYITLRKALLRRIIDDDDYCAGFLYLFVYWLI